MKQHLTILAAIAAIAFLGELAAAAEINFRSDCRPEGNLVRLGELAEIRAADATEAERLAAIDLIPAPAPGTSRVVRIREVQDLLELRGINMAAHRLTGASQMTIAAGAPKTQPSAPRASSPATNRQATQAVRAAIIKHLQDNAGPTEPWEVQFQLSEEEVRQIAAAGHLVAATGGTNPWLGNHQFVVSLQSPSGQVDLPIRARVTLPAAVVVTVHALPRGAQIGSGDVRLEHGTPQSANPEAYQRIEDVIGQETTRSVAAGQVLDPEYVQAPLLVKRGDVVTVYARNAGVQVRTTARAREDGSKGALITVESLTDRASFYAMVSGIQEVEVYARGATANATPQGTIDVADRAFIRPAAFQQPGDSVHGARANGPKQPRSAR